MSGLTPLCEGCTGFCDAMCEVEAAKARITALENAIREIESLIPGQGVEHHFGKAIQSAVDEVNKQGVEE